MSTRSALLEAGLSPVDERLYEQIRRAVLWIAGDVASRTRSDERWHRLLLGTARLAGEKLPLLKAYRLPPLGGEAYRDYFSRAAAALEIADPGYIGEAMGLRECLRSRIAAYDVLLEAVESIDRAAERLSKTCGVGLKTAWIIVYTVLSGVANGLRGLVEDTVKPAGPGRCPVCGYKPVALGAGRESSTASCGLCGLTWSVGRGVSCPVCGSSGLEVLGGSGGDRVYRCLSCGHVFLSTSTGLEALPSLAGEAFLALYAPRA